MIKPHKWALLGTLGVLGLSGMAQATVSMVSSQATFSAAVSSAGVDDLDSLASGQLQALLTRSAGSYGYTAGSLPSTLWGLALPATDVWLSTNSPRASLLFNSLTGGATGFGLDFMVANANGGALSGNTVDVTVYDGSSVASTFQFISGSAASFVGFLSDSGLTAISFNIGSDSSPAYSTVNNVRMAVVVTAVPEPGTYLLMVGGIALIGAIARRRRMV